MSADAVDRDRQATGARCHACHTRSRACCVNERSRRINAALDAERDRLLDLLRRVDTPDPILRYWRWARRSWGGLTAEELWELGCTETVTRFVYEVTEWATMARQFQG